jgi:hypothetical protein
MKGVDYFCSSSTENQQLLQQGKKGNSVGLHKTILAICSMVFMAITLLQRHQIKSTDLSGVSSNTISSPITSSAKKAYISISRGTVNESPPPV